MQGLHAVHMPAHFVPDLLAFECCISLLTESRPDRAHVQLADYMRCSEAVMQRCAARLWRCRGASTAAVCHRAATLPAGPRALLFSQHSVANDASLSLAGKLQRLPRPAHAGVCKATLDSDAALKVPLHNAWMAAAVAAALRELPQLCGLSIQYVGVTAEIALSIRSILCALPGLPSVRQLAMQLEPCRADDAELCDAMQAAAAAVLAELHQARHVRSLHLNMPVPEEAGLDSLAHALRSMPQLEALSFGDDVTCCYVRPDCLVRAISTCTTLTSLEFDLLMAGALSSQDFAPLASLKQLRRLCCHSTFTGFEAAQPAVALLTALQHLELPDCKALTWCGLVRLVQPMTQLTFLHVPTAEHGGRNERQSAAHLQLPQLRTLHAHCACRGPAAAQLAAIDAGLPLVQEVSFECCCDSDEHQVKVLGALARKAEQLTALSWRHHSLAGRSQACGHALRCVLLKCGGNLQRLSIVGTAMLGVTNWLDVRSMCGLCACTHLDLRGSFLAIAVSDLRGMLQSMPLLVRLNLAAVQLGRFSANEVCGCLPELQALEHLTELDISHICFCWWRTGRAQAVFTALRSLSAGSNMLAGAPGAFHLPNSFQHMGKLQRLDLSKQAFTPADHTRLASGLRNLSQLQVMHLDCVIALPTPWLVSCCACNTKDSPS